MFLKCIVLYQHIRHLNNKQITKKEKIRRTNLTLFHRYSSLEYVNRDSGQFVSVNRPLTASYITATSPLMSPIRNYSVQVVHIRLLRHARACSSNQAGELHEGERSKRVLSYVCAGCVYLWMQKLIIPFHNCLYKYTYTQTHTQTSDGDLGR